MQVMKQGRVVGMGAGGTQYETTSTWLVLGGSGGLARLPACPMASGPLKQKTIWAPSESVAEKKRRTPSLKHINKIALSPKVHVLEFDTRF
ncbi:hypothetical protein AVEN_154532-1 [Araneus ventricosus]|uniref:Uncharacterized protein n=1 Tax=Araneus ventricosus TaxID=182803 RepID=A0A4Y2IUG3_ARAVE|nr:hypothetical protein AVEN_154532-1 [Araneus ventricosus]